jgi:hypothetical protein
MLGVTIAAILAIPLTALIVVLGMRQVLGDMMRYLEQTTSVGGEPLTLIRERMKEQLEAAKEARAEQKAVLEHMRERRLNAIGD